VRGKSDRAESRRSPGQPWTLGTALLLAFANITTPLQRCNGLVVKMCAGNSAVSGSIPGFGFHSLRYHDISEIWRNTSHRNIRD
jgi:hypothetical protein